MSISIYNYADTKNESPKTIAISIHDWVDFYYSYASLVGIFIHAVPVGTPRRLILSQNVWNRTTAKHIGWIRKRHSNAVLLKQTEMVTLERESFLALERSIGKLFLCPNADTVLELLALSGCSVAQKEMESR